MDNEAMDTSVGESMDNEATLDEHSGNAILLQMPPEVTASIAWCLDVRDIGKTGPTCQMMAQEVADPEIWFHLFMQACWPPSDTLLAFAEECCGSAANIDWRARLRARTEAPTAIVVDVGRGYSKYTLVHGVYGRSEPEGLPPQIVQLCSSPTHPPDCGREEVLSFIHHKLEISLQEAALDATHPLHATALQGAELQVGGKVLMQGGPSEKFFRLISKKGEEEETEERWELEPWENFEQMRRFGRTRTSSGRFLASSSDLVPVRCASDLPLLVGEPFVETVTRRDGDISSTGWARQVRAQLEGRRGPVRIAPQAQMSLWAHGIDHGIVVNIGQTQTFAIPVVNGEVLPSASSGSNLGGASLTMAMMRLMSQRMGDHDGLMTWSRDIKENYCYVAPPAPGERKNLRARIAAGDDFGIQRISIENPFRNDDSTVELGEERVLVPEALFDPSMGGHPTLPELIAGCAERVRSLGRFSNEAVQKLLQQVVLVGGGADFPGLRPRTEFEVRALLKVGAFPHLLDSLTSADDVFVLNPPLGNHGPLTSPRFVPVVGGCVRAACSLHFRPPGIAAADSQQRRHSIEVSIPQRQLNSRLPEWMQRRRLLLAGASIFRTGGGGGEDDDIWQFIHGDMFMDEDLERELEEDSDSDEDPIPSRIHPSHSFEELHSEEESEQDSPTFVEMQQSQAQSSQAQSSGNQHVSATSSSRSKGASAGKGTRKGRNQQIQRADGKGKTARSAKGGTKGGKSSSSRKGAAKGGSKGKGAFQQRQTWRPVQRE